MRARAPEVAQKDYLFLVLKTYTRQRERSNFGGFFTMTRRLMALFVFGLWGCGSQNVEDTMTENDAVALAEEDVYDFYPGSDANYQICSSPTACPWPGDDFESYSNGTVIECSTASDQNAHLEVTSGCLYSKYAGQYRRGWTDTYNFRMLALQHYSGKKVGWQNIAGTYRGYVESWQAGAPTWSGFHVFARYQSENDLYVGSYRKDGLVTIKKKVGGIYTTLASRYLDIPQTGTWYTFKFSVDGQTLRYYLNGTLQLTATDNAIPWGTTGMRIDYANAYIDDWKAVQP